MDERYGNLHDNGDSAVPLASGRCLPSALLCRGVETNPHLTLYFMQVSLKKKYTAAMMTCSIIKVRSEVTVNKTVCNSQASQHVTRPLMQGDAETKAGTTEGRSVLYGLSSIEGGMAQPVECPGNRLDERGRAIRFPAGRVIVICSETSTPTLKPTYPRVQ